MVHSSDNHRSCIKGLAKSLATEMTREFGPMLSGERLSQALGYPSMGAFRQALLRGRVPVPVFSLPGRRGKYALVVDIAAWIASQREAAAGTMRRTIGDDSESGENSMN